MVHRDGQDQARLCFELIVYSARNMRYCAHPTTPKLENIMRKTLSLLIAASIGLTALTGCPKEQPGSANASLVTTEGTPDAAKRTVSPRRKPKPSPTPSPTPEPTPGKCQPQI